MPRTAAEWDDKHRSSSQTAPAQPEEILRECLPLLPPGSVLDLACGTGRNALFLAAHDRRVMAVDFSSVALEILEKCAKAAGIAAQRSSTLEAAFARRASIRTVCADLETAALPENAFGLILCMRYLQRGLFAAMEHALSGGGALLMETYTVAQTRFAGGPRSPEHLLARGELRVAFPSLEIVFYRELETGKGIATLLARKPKP